MGDRGLSRRSNQAPGKGRGRLPKVALKGRHSLPGGKCRQPSPWEGARKTTEGSPERAAQLAGRQVPSTKPLGSGAEGVWEGGLERFQFFLTL
jgi:hypothetical protein